MLIYDNMVWLYFIKYSVLFELIDYIEFIEFIEYSIILYTFSLLDKEWNSFYNKERIKRGNPFRYRMKREANLNKIIESNDYFDFENK